MTSFAASYPWPLFSLICDNFTQGTLLLLQSYLFLCQGCQFSKLCSMQATPYKHAAELSSWLLFDECNVKEGSVPLCKVPHFYLNHLADASQTTFQPSPGKLGCKTWPSHEDSWEVKLVTLLRNAGRLNLALSLSRKAGRCNDPPHGRLVTYSITL